MGPFLAMTLDEIQIFVDGLRHRYALGLDFLAAVDDSNSLHADFDGFAPCPLDDLGKIRYRLAAPLARFVPLKVVVAFRVMFVLARDPDVVPDQLAVFLDHSGKGPAIA